VVQSSNVTSSNSDDGFHEIQLNGKQLVFLFMAATVVSVVIFLCGVLVGRGVRTERAAMADAQAMNEPPTADIVPAPPPASPSADPTTAPAPSTAEDLGYNDRPENAKEPEELKPAPPKPAAPVASLAAPPPAAPKPSAAPEARAPAATAKAEPPAPVKSAASAGPRSGYAVQVAAMNARREAETRVKRLQAKGYSAYVETPTSGSTLYRVRVGPFKTKGDAEQVAGRLEKEERVISPWVVSP
jgi:cell division septation protein DedD